MSEATQEDGDATAAPVAAMALENTTCPVCECATDYTFRKNGFPIRKCCGCGYLHVAPRPPLETIINHYLTNYRGATADFYPKAASRRWRGFWRSLVFVPYIRGKKVLEIGCGGGFMVEAFGRFAREAVGVDLSENSIAYARKRWPQHRFFAEGLGAFASRGESFDFVFSSEVLEHVLDPHEFMDTLRRCVRPGGYAYVSAPDAGHKAVPRDISTWEDICPPEHLQWFSQHNMVLLFERYGFRLHHDYKSRTPAHSVLFQRLG